MVVDTHAGALQWLDKGVSNLKQGPFGMDVCHPCEVGGSDFDRAKRHVSVGHQLSFRTALTWFLFQPAVGPTLQLGIFPTSFLGNFN